MKDDSIYIDHILISINNILNYKLIHDYIGIDIDVIWKTIEEDLPLLKYLLEKV